MGRRTPSVDLLRSPDGSVEVEVVPQLGARLHRLRAFGHDLLRTPPDLAGHVREPFFWGGYVMAPWCNRLDARPTTVGGRVVDVGPNFPDGTAIHGQVYLRAWDRIASGRYRIVDGGDGWPWRYEVAMLVEARHAELGIDLSVTNRSDDAMPAGIGLHPWFRRPVRVAVHAPTVHPSNLPTAPLPEPVAGPFDLRSMGDPSLGLDATWTDPGDTAAELQWPGVGLTATMRLSSDGGRFVVVATPAGLDAIALEPETHAPQGLRRLLGGEPGGLTWLQPGASLVLRISLGFDRA